MGFQLRGRRYEYGGTGTPHGLTERTVEVPVAMDFLRRRAPAGPALEVGNTLARFLAATGEVLPRTVLDRYERAPGVVAGDILAPPFAARFATIVSVSTVEHVGQRLDPMAAYGDAPGGLEPGGHGPPLLAIKRIHDLLAPGGEALITVPWGQAAELGWQVVFGPGVIRRLADGGYVPADGVDLRVLKRVGPVSGGSLWTEVDPASVGQVPYASAQGHANAVAFLWLRRSATCVRPDPVAAPIRASGLRLPPGSQDHRGAATAAAGLAAGVVEAGILATRPLTADVELTDATTGDMIAAATLRSWERPSVPLTVPHPVAAAVVRWRVAGEPPGRQPDYVAMYRAGGRTPRRVGIDMLGAQSPTSRNRGIGRYLRGLVSALAAVPDGPELTLYWHPGMERSGEGFAREARHVELPARGPAGLQAVVDANPHGLEALIVGSPFETVDGYFPPLRRTAAAPALLSVVYDLIPMVWSQERYLADEGERTRFAAVARRLKRHDGLLAISDSARDDARAYLGIRADRVLAIGTGTDHTFWGAEPGTHDAAGRFLLAMCAPDPRKNADGLIRALAVLGDWGVRFPPLRLVMSGSEAARAATMATVAELKLEAHVTLLQDVSDEELRALYRAAVCLVFPSGYEGFGLPLAEAMSGGLPVVGVHNSSQPEVVGDAGITATSGAAIELARALAGVCDGTVDLPAHGERGRERARTFTWEAVAGRLVLALEAIDTPPASEPDLPLAGHSAAVEVALTGPAPPEAAHVGCYTAALATALKTHAGLRWWQTGAAIPLLEAWSPQPVLLPSTGRFGGGISAVIYEHMPGTTVPPSVAATASDGLWFDLHEVPLVAESERVEPPEWWLGRLPARVLVHSHTLRDRLAADRPELAGRIHVLPIGLPPGPNREERDAARALRHFGPGDIVVGLPAETDPEAAVALVQAVAEQPRTPGGGEFRVLAEEPLSPALRETLHGLMRDTAARPCFWVLGLMSPAELRAARGATDVVLVAPSTGADELGLLRDHLAGGAIPIAAATTHYGPELVGPVLLTDGSQPSLAGILARLADPGTFTAFRDQATAWRARHRIEEVARCIHELIRAPGAGP